MCHTVIWDVQYCKIRVKYDTAFYVNTLYDTSLHNNVVPHPPPDVRKFTFVDNHPMLRSCLVLANSCVPVVFHVSQVLCLIPCCSTPLLFTFAKSCV
jgi:hypothetical protein